MCEIKATSRITHATKYTVELSIKCLKSENNLNFGEVMGTLSNQKLKNYQAIFYFISNHRDMKIVEEKPRLKLFTLSKMGLSVMGIDYHAGKQRARSRKIIIASIPITAFLVLFFAHRFQRIKALRRYKAILKENCK